MTQLLLPVLISTGESQPKAGGDEYNVEENEEKSEIDKQAAVAESDKGLHGNNTLCVFGGRGGHFISPWSLPW